MTNSYIEILNQNTKQLIIHRFIPKPNIVKNLKHILEYQNEQ